MPKKQALKSRNLDNIDKKILMFLQDNARASLTSIAKKVNLSIDSVNKRIKSMLSKNIFEFGIFIEPRNIGYPLISDIKIKLKNVTKEEKDLFVSYLKNHKKVIDLLSIMGQYDFTCVIIAKSTAELDKISTEIRQRFSNLISDWSAMLILKTHKFEEFDLFR